MALPESAARPATWRADHAAAFYRQAYSLFGQHRYVEALALFRVLCLYAPHVRHAHGMTECLAKLGDAHVSPDIDTALLSYALSAAYDGVPA